MTIKRPPELTWQDKAILITIPVVVFTIFILANYLGQDATVEDAFASQLKSIEVRDGGIIKQIYPQTATDSIRCRLESKEKTIQYDFVYNITGSETLKLEVGRMIQFYGRYEYDQNGGVVTTPYKGKSGNYDGWAIYGNNRYTAQQPTTNTATASGAL